MDLRPGAVAVITDGLRAGVRPPQNVATPADTDPSGLTGPILGHVADDFHCIRLVGPESANELVAARSLSNQMAGRGLAAVGACTGERDAGLGKRRHLLVRSGEGVAVMAQLARALDPADLTNPGKILLILPSRVQRRRSRAVAAGNNLEPPADALAAIGRKRSAPPTKFWSGPREWVCATFAVAI